MDGAGTLTITTRLEDASVVDRHRGTIAVDSGAEGTTMRVCVPIRSPLR